LELVRSGQLPEAHQLHLMYYERVAPNTDLNEYYEKRFPDTGSQIRKQIEVSDPYGEMRDYFKTAPLKDIVQASKSGQYQLESVSVLVDEATFTIVELQYQYSFGSDGKKTSIPVQVRMKRSLLPTGSKQWNVESVTTPGGSPPPVRRPTS
jgi:hypothetical protein